ncbi:MAG: YceI family protein [Candidatus Competibacteraceae bacterium]|nr:YceI family protein [Candidatus Competibacteraceae bacterium]
MLKRWLWQSAAVLGFGLAALGVQAGQALAPEQSEITFVGKQMGASAQGRFQKFTADAALDPAAIDKSRIRVVIDMNSVALPASDFTTEVKRKRWFDTAGFPEATFESKQFRKLDGGAYQVDGILTLKGVSRDISAPLSLKTEGSDLLAEGQFEIKRLDFNVGDGQWADTDTVANEVQIKFKLRLKPRP